MCYVLNGYMEIFRADFQLIIVCNAFVKAAVESWFLMNDDFVWLVAAIGFGETVVGVVAPFGGGSLLYIVMRFLQVLRCFQARLMRFSSGAVSAFIPRT